MKNKENKTSITYPPGTFILKNDPWDIQEITITIIDIGILRSFVEFEFICETDPNLNYELIPELYVKILDEEEINNKDILVEKIIKEKNIYDYCLIHGLASYSEKLENSYYGRGYFDYIEMLK